MAQFEIHSLDGSRAEQAFALASLNFATQSVLHKALGAGLEEYRAYLRPTFFNNLGDGLSLMATGPGSGELTSTATQKVVLEKMGHRKSAEIAFAEFTLNGRLPFATITDPKTVILAEETL